MKKFLVLYLIPAAVVADWMKTDPETRQAAEEKMRGEWMAWTTAHASAIGDTGSGGKTKRVTADGASDTRNDIMIYSFVEAESHEAATAMFDKHPHLQIPQASIEIMEAKPMGGMA